MDEKLKSQIANIVSNLTDEQKEKVKNCKSLSEFNACLSEMGDTLSDEELDSVTGGAAVNASNQLSGAFNKRSSLNLSSQECSNQLAIAQSKSASSFFSSQLDSKIAGVSNTEFLCIMKELGLL